jgi:hypothetical protein
MATRLRWSVGKLQLKQDNLLLQTVCEKELFTKLVTDISFHLSPQYSYNIMLVIYKPNKSNKIDLFLNNPYTEKTVSLSGCQLSHSSSKLLPCV